MEQLATKRWNWGRIGDGAVLLAYSSVVLWTLQHHEKWADEAQAWLIARDLDLGTIWFHELRYEGSPGLWHTILWVAQHVFHAPYGVLGYIGALFAIAGTAVLIFLAPFPRIVRWPLAFTYFMVYQYAVIARPYTLLPLLAFCAALLFKDLRHPERLTAVLILLALLTLHGTLLAACLGLAYLARAYRQRQELDRAATNRYIYSVAAMALALLFVVVILKPTPDVGEFVVKKALAQSPEVLRGQIQPGPMIKAEAILSGAFLDLAIPSVAFVVLAGWWFYRRGRLLEYALPVAMLVSLYCFVHGYAHHHGTVFVATIAAAWIAWPLDLERSKFTTQEVWETRGMVALLLCLCAVNMVDAEVVIHRDYVYPYCGARDAADYLRTVGADKGPMFGFLYGVNAVQAYFDHNLFSNMSSSYYHNGAPLEGTNLNVSELQRVRPEYVVAYSSNPQLMADYDLPFLKMQGYQLVHFSDGYYLYKRAVYQREVYFIFRRVSGDWDMAAHQNGTTTANSGHPQ
jgi:hypothetical protein